MATALKEQRDRPRAHWAAISVYIACFTVGGFNHARDFWAFGPRPYNFSWAASWLEAFWSALVLLDFAVVSLLIAGKRRTGLALAAAVMVCDVGANSCAAFAIGLDGFSLALPLQATFLGFILGSILFLWPKARPDQFS